MTFTKTRTEKSAMTWIIGTAIALTVAGTSAGQAQNYGSQGSFNDRFARHNGAGNTLNNGARAQNYRQRLQMQRMSPRNQRLFGGQTAQSQNLRARGHIAQHTRHDAARRQMFQRRYAIDAQRRQSYSSNRGYSSNRSYRSGPRRSSYVSRSSTRANGRKWNYSRNSVRSTGSRSSYHTNSRRYTRSSMRSTRSYRSARSARSARNAAKAARFARTARYARYATGAGAVAALGGVDPITLGIHAVTRPEHFAKRASYYARNPHMGVYQVGKNAVNNTRKIGCGVGNIFKKKRNRSRCR